MGNRMRRPHHQFVLCSHRAHDRRKRILDRRSQTDAELSIVDGVAGAGCGPPGRAARRELGRDDEDQREDEGDGEQDAATGDGGRGVVGECCGRVWRAGAVGRGEGDEDAEPESAAQLVCGVDEAGDRTGFPCGDAGDAG
jgi:hypothetical protein